MACCSIPSMAASSATALQVPKDRVCFSSKPCPDVIRMPCLRRAIVKAQATGGGGNVKVQQQQQSNNAVQQQQQEQRQPQQQWNTRNRQSTPLTPFDSWDPFMPASRSFGQMMDVMNQMLDGVSGTAPTTMQRRTTTRVPWDVLEDEEGFNMRVDMPDLTKDEVKVFIDDGVLVIKGEVSSERREKDKWAARSGGSYESRVAIPDNVEMEQIKAELKDGVLYVAVPKKKVEPKKPIDIKVS